MFTSSQEEVLLARDCEAIVIPHGYRTNLAKGTRLRVVQELGGSVTVTAEFGGLFRIDPDQFDAIGRAVPQAPPPEQLTAAPIDERIWETLRTCYDPEIPVNIVELGLVYDCRALPAGEDGRHDIEVKMTLTAPGCGMGDVLAQDVQQKLEKMPDVAEARVEIVFDPPWNQNMMSEAARLQLGFF